MHVLRISHTGSHVETSFVGHVLADQTVVGQALPPGNLVAQPLRPVSDKRPFDFTLSPQDAEDIRWYLEDYRIYPVEPLPKTAARIEPRMNALGRERFQKALAGSGVWQGARCELADTRIEIETELTDGHIPWELLRDPVADLPLALSVHSFVRTHSRRPCFQIRLRSPRASPASSSLSAARTQGTTFPSAPLPATCCAA